MPAGRFASVALLILAPPTWAACTSAEFGDPAVVGAGGGPDAGAGRPSAGVDAGGGTSGPVPGPDAAPPAPEPAEPDAGPTRLDLTQSGSLDVIGQTAVACFDNGDEEANSFYRVFDLAAEGVTGPVEVTGVTFGVEQSDSGGGGLPATVLLHTLAGPFDPTGNDFNLDNLTELASTDTVVPDVVAPPQGQPGGLLHEVPIQATVPAGSRLVVEVAHQAFRNQGRRLLMGANQAAQTGLTYTRAPACRLRNPTDADTLQDGAGNNITMHWVLVVQGTTTGG